MSDTSKQALENFIEKYNLLFNVPDFVIDKDTCEQYRREHPNDFKGAHWSIAKHRKKLMDWIPKYQHMLKQQDLSS